jgi:hypothetical protein
MPKLPEGQLNKKKLNIPDAKFLQIYDAFAMEIALSFQMGGPDVETRLAVQQIRWSDPCQNRTRALQ